MVVSVVADSGWTLSDCSRWENKELQEISRRAREKRRCADKLVKVWQRDGQVEIRADYEKDFPERMFVYYYRLFDRYRLPWVSLVVLADDQPQWRPDHYARELWGCKLELCFPVIKLLDFQERLAEPEADPNPFTGFRGFWPDTRSYWQCRTRMRPRNRTVLRCASSRRASQPEYFAWTLCPGVRDAS